VKAAGLEKYHDKAKENWTEKKSVFEGRADYKVIYGG